MALRLRPAVLGAPLAVIVLGLAACDSSPPKTPQPSSHPSPTATPASPTPVPPFTPPVSTPTPSRPSGPAYSVQVALTGPDALQGGFSQPVAQCQVPTDLSSSVSGQQLDLRMPGAGTTGQAQTLSPGDLVLTIGSHTWGVASAANAPHPTAGTLQRNADGSGSAVFQNLALQGNPSQQPQESGTITWTCG